MQTIRRSKKDSENPYKSIRRATFEDNRLSFEARGVLGYILVKPDDWRINVTDLMKQGDMGRDKTYRILNELIETGYCERVELRDRGRIVGYDYLINEEPCTEKPLTEKPYTAKPLTENQDHTNKEVPLKKKETKEDDVAAQRTSATPQSSKKFSPEEIAIKEAFKKLKEKHEPGCIIVWDRENGAIRALAKEKWSPEKVVECGEMIYAETWRGKQALSLWTIAKEIGAKVKRTPPLSPAAPQPELDWTSIFGEPTYASH